MQPCALSPTMGCFRKLSNLLQDLVREESEGLSVSIHATNEQAIYRVLYSYTPGTDFGVIKYNQAESMTWLSASFTQHCSFAAVHGKLLIDKILSSARTG